MTELERDGVYDQVLAFFTNNPTPHDLQLRRQALERITRYFDWKLKQRVCKENFTLLDAWQQRFIDDLFLNYWDVNKLSESQMEKLNQAYERLVFEHGVDHRPMYIWGSITI